MTADTMKIQGRSYPVQARIYIKPLSREIPLLSIRMMSDERERELGAQSAEKWKEAMA